MKKKCIKLIDNIKDKAVKNPHSIQKFYTRIAYILNKNPKYNQIFEIIV